MTFARIFSHQIHICTCTFKMSCSNGFITIIFFQVACVFTGCDFIANDRVGFFNHVPDHDGDKEVKVLEFSNVVFVINV